jgi:acetylornithine deacetylase
VDGQNWTTDPWMLTERDGRLYGRGTTDMKGFVALALATVPLALAAGVKRPIQIALSHDEELGLLGAPPLIAAMTAGLPRAGAVIVGEPSGMWVITGQKGGAGYRVTLRGHPVHSSRLPYGVSAVMEAARLVGWINDQNARLQAAVPSALAAPFDPPFTTLHVGMLQGGTAQNITAEHAEFVMEFRIVPGEDATDWYHRWEAEIARLDRAMRSVHPAAGIMAERFFDAPPLNPAATGAAEELARRLTGDNAVQAVSYGTEAGHFQAAGYPTVICGPGDIDQAHQADEYLTEAQFDDGWRFMQRLVAELAA